MDMQNSPTMNPNNPQGPAMSAPSVDIMQVLWRWKFMILLGAVVGAGIGYLNFKQTPLVYKATASIQVVSPQDNVVPMIAIEGAFSSAKTRADDIRVLLSRTVLESAVENSNLRQHSKLLNKSKQEIVNWIRSGKKLVVQPGTKDLQTTIIDISFECEDAELAGKVVEAVQKGYEKYLGMQYKNLGEEVRQVLTEAKADMDQKFSESNKKYQEFRKNSGLIFNNNQGEDPYYKELVALTQKIQANRDETRRIETTLEQVKKASEANRDPENLLPLLSQLVQNVWGWRDEGSTGFRPAISANVSPNTPFGMAEKLETDILLERRLKLNSLLSSLGEGHSEVKKMRQEIKLLEQQIEMVRSQEKEFYDKKQSEVAQNNQTEDEVTSIADRVKVMVGALGEKMSQLKIEAAKLTIERNEQQARSQEMQGSLAKLKLLEQELEMSAGVRKQLDETLNKVELVPNYGQKTMKELDRTERGTLSGPSQMKYLAIGGLLGALVCAGLGYLLELVDRSFRSPDEIATELAIPILAHIPQTQISPADRKDDQIDLSVVSVHRSKSSQSEAYRGVRTGLYFNNRNGETKVIQVTSPVPGDGKSTTAANLAVTMAQSGRKTLLLDADFRRPRVAKLFGTREDIGITSAISGHVELPDAIQVTSVDNLSVLACGKRPGNPAELLSSERFDEMLQLLREQFDYVIIDSPPLLAVSDPANVAARVDGVILTLRLRRNLKPLAHRAIQMLRSVNANVIGVVVNGVGGNRGYGQGYRYGYGYGGRYGYGRGGYGQSLGYGYGGSYGYGYGGEYGVTGYYEDDAKEKRANRTARRNPTSSPDSASLGS